MEPVLMDLLLTLCRYGAVALSAYLVEHHLLTADQSDTFTMEVIKHLTLLLPGLLAVSWGLLRNIWHRQAVLTALMMPHGSTENDLKAQIKTGVTPTVTTPPDTAPGVPLQGVPK